MIVGSGIDVVEVSRIDRALARRGERFERRVFTAREIAACRRGKHPGAKFAICFAVKEATMKAVGTGWARGVGWLDVETRTRSDTGQLDLTLHRGAALWARRLGAARVHVAVARSVHHALALVVLEADG